MHNYALYGKKDGETWELIDGFTDPYDPWAFLRGKEEDGVEYFVEEKDDLDEDQF